MSASMEFKNAEMSVQVFMPYPTGGWAFCHDEISRCYCLSVKLMSLSESCCVRILLMFHCVILVSAYINVEVLGQRW